MIKDSLLEVLATRASVELARVAAVRPALGKALRAGRGHLGGTRGGATRGCDPGAGPLRRTRRLPRARERWGGLPGGGEGLLALLVSGLPRAAPPVGRGLAGVQARARVLGAVASGFGSSIRRGLGQGC
jgi:hypothetical protein